MTGYRAMTLSAAMLVAATMLAGQSAAQVPPAIAAPGEPVVATFHAEGAQVYECKAGGDGVRYLRARGPSRQNGNRPSESNGDGQWSLHLCVSSRSQQGLNACHA